MTPGGDFGTRAFVWDRCFLFCSRDFMLDRGARSYRRLSATVIVSLDGPFRVITGRSDAPEFSGVLIGPNTSRAGIQAAGSRIVLLDAGCTTAAFEKLRPRLPADGIRELGDAELAQCRATIARLDRVDLDCDGARVLFEEILAQIAGDASDPHEVDERVVRAVELVEARLFDETSVKGIASEVGISESRLRALFQEEWGCSLSHFIRWSNTWKAIRLWRGRTSFTEAAHAAGFYDLAHLDRALTGSFGISPRAITRGPGMRFHFCMEDPAGRPG